MPVGTPVDRVYQALLREGRDPGSAARIAQAQTGLALATGKPPKGKRKKLRKAGAGALNYPMWTTQSQKADGEEEDMMVLPSKKLVGKFNPNHDERGRFSSGSGGGTSMAVARGKKPSGSKTSGRTSLKALRFAFHSAVKDRKKLDSNIANLRSRMSQYKRSSQTYKTSADRLQRLKLQRTEMTRELNRLSSAISRRAGPKYSQDWVRSAMAGFPIYSSTSARPSRKSAGADLFEIRRCF